MWAAMSDCRKPKWSLFIPVLLCLTVLAGCGESAEKITENSDTGNRKFGYRICRGILDRLSETAGF